MCSLEDSYNRLLGRRSHKSCYYYDDSPNGYVENFSLEVSAKKFIENYFVDGIKRDIVGEFFSTASESMLFRSEHMRSVFLLGILLFDSVSVINSYICQFLASNIQINTRDNPRNIFLYIWYLACLSHDVGYCYENGEREADINLMDIGADVPGIPQELLRSVLSYYDLKRNTKLLGGKACQDHGISGGKKVDSILRELHNHDSPIEVKDGNAVRTFSKDIYLNLVRIATYCVMTHNMFLAFKGSREENTYNSNGLDQLVCERNKSIISPSRNPFLFLLCLVDTIEPIKLFIDEADANNATFRSRILKILRSINLNFNDNGFTVSIQIPCPDPLYCALGVGDPDSELYCSMYNKMNKIVKKLDFLYSPEFSVTNQNNILEFLFLNNQE